MIGEVEREVGEGKSGPRKGHGWKTARTLVRCRSRRRIKDGSSDERVVDLGRDIGVDKEGKVGLK